MTKQLLELVVGDLEEKKAWRKMTKRAKALPENYRYAFSNIQHYFNNFGCDIAMLTDLLDLFETSAIEGKPVQDIVGNDVAKFCDELLEASGHGQVITREQLNNEIKAYFQKEAQSDGK